MINCSKCIPSERKKTVLKQKCVLIMFASSLKCFSIVSLQKRDMGRMMTLASWNEKKIMKNSLQGKRISKKIKRTILKLSYSKCVVIEFSI